MNQNNIILVTKSIKDYTKIKEKENTKIFSCDYASHKKLQELGIFHYIGENILDSNERIEIFNLTKRFQNWYKNDSLKKFNLNGVNLLGLLDGIELHLLIIEKLINFYTIKKILDTEDPNSIECSDKIKNIILLIKKNNFLKIKINSKEEKEDLLWDSVNIKQNFMGIPISIKMSRAKFHKLKNILDKTVSSIFGLWFELKNKERKTILILEMYPPVYEKLFKNLKNKDVNLIIINQRRPVTYDLKSINVLKKSNCKLISKNDIFEKNDLEKIEIKKREFRQKISNFWDEDILNEIFKIDDFIFWSLIKNELKEVFTKRLDEYIESIFFAKKIFTKINISCILSLYDIGETEKVFLESKNEDTKSFLLEHGFSLLFEDSKTFGTLMSYDNFRDNIIVWSEYQKQFLISNYKINSDRIFALGSPRHDVLNQMNHNKKKGSDIQVLIAPTPITQLQGFDTTEIHEKYDNLIMNICKILEKYNNIKIIFKMHPSQSDHNNELIKIIKKYSKKVPIYLLNPISELIQKSDLIITITPEGWAPSTIILESMILEKPVMNIILDEKMYEFEYIKQNAVISIPYSSDLENKIKEFLFNEQLKHDLIKNSKIFIKGFLKNQGSASEKITDTITSY